MHTNVNDYTKHNHDAEDYANRPHKEFLAVFTTFNKASYFNLNFNRNFNFKTETGSSVNSLA
jgi:hypothetical protein